MVGTKLDSEKGRASVLEIVMIDYYKFMDEYE